MAVINTNLTSLVSQQNLSNSRTALASSMERLSSGLRVNSAKDDAAGQAIGNRIQAQRTGLGQAARNANDGVSLSQTAHGVLDNINDKLQRIRELTVQGLNGTNQTQDSDAIQAEINQNLQEIDRLAKTTKYNGIPLMTGQAGKVDLQVGANDGEKLGVDLSPPGFDVAALGLTDFNVAGVPGSVTHRETLEGQADDIVLADSRTFVDYGSVGAEHKLFTLDNAQQSGNHQANTSYYISMGEGDFRSVNVVATHETATDTSEVSFTNVQPMYRNDTSLNETEIQNINASQRLIQVEDSYYIEAEEDGLTTYREASFAVSSDGTATISVNDEYLNGDDYYAAVDEQNAVININGTTYSLGEFDEIIFSDLDNNSALVMGDSGSQQHYYVKDTSGASVSYYSIDSVSADLVITSDELAEAPDETNMAVTEGLSLSEFKTSEGENFDTYTVDPSLSYVDVVKYEDTIDNSVEYFLRTADGAGGYNYHAITNTKTTLSIKPDTDNSFAGPDLLTLKQESDIELGANDKGVNHTPAVGNFTGTGVTANFPDEFQDNNPALVQRTDTNRWVIRVGDGSGENGYSYYDADVTVELDAKGEPVSFTATTEQTEPTILGVDGHQVEKVHGTSTVTIDPRNVVVEYTDIEGRVYENVLREGDDGTYYFELPGESSLQGGYKTATLADFDGLNEILLRTENGASEVVVYYPTELNQSANPAFFVYTDANGFTEGGDPITRLRIQEAGEDFRLQVPRNPLAALDRAIGMVDAKRSYLGATENRLASVIEGNQITATNLAAAQSRIMDADYAVEVANMTRAQILQQAGNSVLAQANVTPESVLALLE